MLGPAKAGGVLVPGAAASPDAGKPPPLAGPGGRGAGSQLGPPAVALREPGGEIAMKADSGLRLEALPVSGEGRFGQGKWRRRRVLP